MEALLAGRRWLSGLSARNTKLDKLEPRIQIPVALSHPCKADKLNTVPLMAWWQSSGRNLRNKAVS